MLLGFGYLYVCYVLFVYSSKNRNASDKHDKFTGLIFSHRL